MSHMLAQCWVPRGEGFHCLGRGTTMAPGEMFLLHLSPTTPLRAGRCRGLVCALVAPGDQVWGLGAAGTGLLPVQPCPRQCPWPRVQLSRWCFIHPRGSASLLLSPCHSSAPPSPPVRRQGLPSGSALPACPRSYLAVAPGALKPPFSRFSSLRAASPWAHAPAGPPTMLLPPALLCCLVPSCLHLAGPSPARGGSECERGGRSPISLRDPSRDPELVLSCLVEP